MKWLDALKHPPTKDREVLITNGDACLIARCFSMRGEPFWMTVSGRAFPTHWMPLPKMPTRKKMK